MTGSAALERARRALAPVVAARGYDLEDASLTPAGTRRVLRVVVDRDGGVGLDEVAELSRELSAALDDSGVLGAGPYVLEVSSPGVDRPLTLPRHWRRAAGRLVTASLAGGGQVTGRVTAAEDDAVVLATPAGERRLAFAELRRGHVQVEFRRQEGADE